MNFFNLLAMFLPAAVAAPVYQTELSITPFQKNVDGEIEDRSNLGPIVEFVNQLAFYGIAANVVLLTIKSGVVYCATHFQACFRGVINGPTSNFNKYDTFEAPQYILTAADLIMSNRSVENVPFNFTDFTPTNDNTASVQWKHLMGSMAKAVPVTLMSDKAEKQQQGYAVVITHHPLSFPVHAIDAPYFKFEWPMYSNYGNVFRPYSVSV